MEEITATELKQRIDRGDDLQIIDVREPNEFDVARIPGTKLIPLGQVVARKDEIEEGLKSLAEQSGKNIAKLRVEYRDRSKRELLVGMILENKVLDIIEEQAQIEQE